MNKSLKITLIIFNIVMLAIAVLWFLEKKEKEPLIVSIGQIITILGLVFERQASKVFAKGIENSEIKIKKQNGDDIHAEEVKDSKIDIC